MVGEKLGDGLRPVYPSSKDCSLMCGFNDEHTGQKHFAQCLFSCLALTNKVYGSSMENCFFPFPLLFQI